MTKQKTRSQLLIIQIIFMLTLSIIIQPVIASPGYNDDNGYADDAPGNSQEPPGPANPSQNTDNQNEAPSTDNPTDSDEETEQPNNGNQYQQGNGPNQDDDENNDDQESSGNNQQHQYQHQKGDMDGDRINDEQERFQQRNMTMTQEQNRTHIRSEWIGEQEHDAFEIFFSTEDGIQIQFKYVSNATNDKVDLSFNISFYQLIEYIDENANGRYDDNDTILTNYSLVDPEYTALKYTIITSEDNETLTRIQTSTIDNLFSIVVYVTGNYSQIQNLVISPSEIKMDFIITNYSFTDNASFLSLESELTTIHTVDMQTDTFDEEQGHAMDEHQLEVSSLNHTAFFSWLQTALVDNETKEVNATVVSSIEQSIINDTKEWSKTSTIYLCYPQGESIVHDPKIGVESISYASFASLSKEVLIEHNIFAFFAILFIASLAFIGIVMVRKTR